MSYLDDNPWHMFGITSDTILRAALRASRESSAKVHKLLLMAKRWKEQEKFDRIVAAYMQSKRKAIT